MSDFKIQPSSYSVVEHIDLKHFIHVIANDEIFHLLALSELVVKCHPHTFISVDVVPTIQPHSSGLPEIAEGRFPL